MHICDDIIIIIEWHIRLAFECNKTIYLLCNAGRVKEETDSLHGFTITLHLSRDIIALYHKRSCGGGIFIRHNHSGWALWGGESKPTRFLRNNIKSWIKSGSNLDFLQLNDKKIIIFGPSDRVKIHGRTILGRSKKINNNTTIAKLKPVLSLTDLKKMLYIIHILYTYIQ